MSSLAIIQICSLAIGIYHRWDGIAAETSILDIAVLCSVRTWFEDNINLLILHGGKSFNFFSSLILVSVYSACGCRNSKILIAITRSIKLFLDNGF